MNEFLISSFNKKVLALAEELHKKGQITLDDIGLARNYFKVNPRGTATCKFMKKAVTEHPDIADFESKTFGETIVKICKSYIEDGDSLDSKIGSKVLEGFGAVMGDKAFVGKAKELLAVLEKIKV